jgi:transposase
MANRFGDFNQEKRLFAGSATLKTYSEIATTCKLTMTNSSSVVRLFRLSARNLHVQCAERKSSFALLAERDVQGLPNGKLLTFFKLTVHQCWCPKCRKTFYETFSFLSSPKARITKALEQLILKLRCETSIKGIAEHFNISRSAVKDVEKAYLADKYGPLMLMEKGSCRI